MTYALDDLGEFSLIERIIARLGDAAARDILAPPGDDAAAWTAAEGAHVATIDVLVEGNHWRRDTMTPADAGWRAVAANVSDLAAMGAQPQFLLVAVTLGPGITVEDVAALAEGLADGCRAHRVRIAGGDIVHGPATAISISAHGTAAPGASGAPTLLRRGGARPGDVVAVSGTPGKAAAGLVLIEAGREQEEGADALARAHRRPRARIALGQAAVAAGVACAIDVSDGLMQDLGHVARASGVGIEIAIPAIPLAPAAVALLDDRVAVDLALGGGEDFELALTGPEAALRSLSRPDLPVTVIGRVVGDHPGEVVARDAAGTAYEPPRRGWDQLRQARP